MPAATVWPVLKQVVLKRERWPGGNQIQGTPLVTSGQEVLPDQPVLRFPAAAGRSEAIPAGLHGQVVALTRRGGVVIESCVALVRGTLGIGNQVAGMLTLWQAGTQSAIPPGAILVIPGSLNFALLRQAVISEVAGIVAGSIPLRDLEGFLRADLLTQLALENQHLQMHVSPLTLLLTEGPGSASIPLDTVNLLKRYQGSIALLTGKTSVHPRAFPELLVSLPLEEVQRHWQPAQPAVSLLPGARVRICGGERKSAQGVIDYLFSYEQLFPAGIYARAARLRLADGSLFVVPLALLERIG